MAKCDLSIELDDPQAVYFGGAAISGIVRVHADADVTCNGLEVKTVWRTHGRGNVDQSEAGSATLFTGHWQAGKQYEYRFELPVAQWPPTYHGFYLNVDHYVDARAKIPWAFDPKASAQFAMRPSADPDVAAANKAIMIEGRAAQVVGCIFALAFLPFMIFLCAAGPFALFFLLLPIGGGIFWLVRYGLPKWMLGNVHCELAAERFQPGERVSGELVIQPRKQVSIDHINMDFTAREQCVSGSGSNRTTHRHVLLEQTHQLSGPVKLVPGVEHRYPIDVALPEDAAYSIDLSNNKLIWSTNLRVGLPRWPDWKKELSLSVLPSADSNEVNLAHADVRSAEIVGRPAAHAGANRSPTASKDAEAGGGITFGETVQHLWSLREDREQVERLVEAVSGLTFDVEAIIERRLLYAGENDPNLDADGFAVWAHYPDPKLPLVLYVPQRLGDEFEQMGRDVWRGRATIVGWDGLHGRLLLQLESAG